MYPINFAYNAGSPQLDIDESILPFIMSLSHTETAKVNEHTYQLIEPIISKEARLQNKQNGEIKNR